MEMVLYAGGSSFVYDEIRYARASVVTVDRMTWAQSPS